tara:strand:+ start:934 stop:1539 length:606 start_codon:yes stop_codon:yes gene_type:complete
MLLSEFLKLHGDIKLKKACHIKCSLWNDMVANLRPPTRTTALNICNYLGGDSKEKIAKYQNMLFDSILEIQRPVQTLKMVLHIEPVAAPRPRFTKFGRPYNPKSYTDWKKRFSDLVGDIGTITDGCTISARYYFQSTSTSSMGYHTKKKDIDNIDKAILDALQMNGLLEDDKTVYRMDSTKYYGFTNKIELEIKHNGFWTN